jgi:thymidylate kinase
MFWLLIEGDNGTGKDTLRTLFERDGWRHSNDSSQAASELDAARRCVGRDRIPAYLRYCRACATGTHEPASRSVTVRYWPSTLAGGFADGLLDERELDDLLKQCVRDLPAPDAVIELRCNLGTRTERIQQRIPDYAGSIDSIDPDRARLHRLALTRIASQWNRPWLVLETTTMNQHQVFDAAKEWVTAQGGSAR